MQLNYNGILRQIRYLNYDKVVDSHCHIDTDIYTDTERNDAITTALDYKIVMITSPLTRNERIRALHMQRKYINWIYITIGSHPMLDEPYEHVIDFIYKHEKEIVGIGEVGLDFVPPTSLETRKKQIQKFRHFIDLSKTLKKPLIVHSRGASRYVLEILMKEDAEKVLLHGFSGNKDIAKIGIEAGYFFSIPPTAIISPKKKRLIEHIPIENLLLESDSPAISPFPNLLSKPWFIFLSAASIAQIKKINIEEVIKETNKNAVKLFGIKL